MLSKVYLSYLHIQMQIHRLLAKTDSIALPNLLQISEDMLQTVLQIANARDRAVFRPRDLSTVVRSLGNHFLSILRADIRPGPCVWFTLRYYTSHGATGCCKKPGTSTPTKSQICNIDSEPLRLCLSA